MESCDDSPSPMDMSLALTYKMPIYPSLQGMEFYESANMRQTFQEIIPNLFLGPYASATKACLTSMKAHGLTHVICVRDVIERQFIQANHLEHFSYAIVEFCNTPLDNIVPQVKKVSAFLEQFLNSGGRVLIHGNSGNNRSAALIVGYLMLHYGMTLARAASFVQQKRVSIAVSHFFMDQLREFEPIYKGPPLAVNLKRSFVESEDNGNEDYKIKKFKSGLF